MQEWLWWAPSTRVSKLTKQDIHTKFLKYSHQAAHILAALSWSCFVELTRLKRFVDSSLVYLHSEVSSFRVCLSSVFVPFRHVCLSVFGVLNVFFELCVLPLFLPCLFVSIFVSCFSSIQSFFFPLLPFYFILSPLHAFFLFLSFFLSFFLAFLLFSYISCLISFFLPFLPSFLFIFYFFLSYLITCLIS